MSKYIIDLDDRIKFVIQVGVTESGNAFSLTPDYVHNLEELNSDYINEHFGELQDEAYQRGFEDGRWKAEDGCTGCKYEGNAGEHLPCEYCMNNFKNQWTAKQTDRIEVGDVVERYIDGKFDSRGIYLQEEDGYWRCLFDTGAVLMTFAYPKGQFKKTGKHYDIQSILEAMRK